MESFLIHCTCFKPIFPRSNLSSLGNLNYIFQSKPQYSKIPLKIRQTYVQVNIEIYL